MVDHHQRTTIPLPSDALVEVFAFLPRAARTRLALLNRHVAPIFVTRLSAERQTVGQVKDTNQPLH